MWLRLLYRACVYNPGFTASVPRRALSLSHRSLQDTREAQVEFGSLSHRFSSRHAFRKSSEELRDPGYTDSRDREDEVRVRLGRRNTPYWYFLQCKKLIKQDKLAEALELFEKQMLRVDRLQPEEFNYTVLIGGCGRHGYVKKAFKLYNEMKKRGIPPSDATYTALFNVCAESPWKQAGLQQAVDLQQELKRKNIQLSTITYHALIKTHALCSGLRASLTVLREMMQDGHAVTQEAFNILLMGCIKDKEHGFRLALQVWRQMLRVGVKPDSHTYNLLLRAARDCHLGDAGLLLGAEQTPADVSGRPHTGEVKPVLDVEALETRLFSSRASGEVRLQTVAESTPVATVNPVAVATRGCERLALLGGAEGVLSRMGADDVKPDMKTLTLLAELTEANSQSELSLLNIAEQCALEPDRTFFNTLLRKKARAGQLSAAKALLPVMVERGLMPDQQTYSGLALACSTEKDGMQLISEMLACGLAPNTHVYSALISSACRKLDYVYLKAILKSMRQNQVVPTELVIKQLEFAARYPPKYDKYKCRNIYLEKIDGFRGYYTHWLKTMPGQETPHPWDRFKLANDKPEQDSVEGK